MITVLGFPRSGTNWLHRILAYGHKVKKVHWEYQLLGNEEIIYIHRDPRDTAVSGYYYYLQAFGWKQNHTIENFSLLDFLETKFSDGFDGYAGWPIGWFEHTRWARQRQFPSISYEGLAIDPMDELSGLFNVKYDWLQTALRNEPPGGTKRVDYTHNLGWADAQKTISPGPGEWKHHFGPKEIEWMNNYLNGCTE